MPDEHKITDYAAVLEKVATRGLPYDIRYGRRKAEEQASMFMIPVIHFLRRLADSDRTLQRYQINPATDAQTIVDAEHAGFLVRHFKQMARRSDQRFLRATITPQGRDLLTEMDAFERVIREDKAVLQELADR